MADEDNGNVTTPEAMANGADNQPQIGVIQQYVKDLSVENPILPTLQQSQVAKLFGNIWMLWKH